MTDPTLLDRLTTGPAVEQLYGRGRAWLNGELANGADLRKAHGIT